MKIFINPLIEIIEIDADDIITTSSPVEKGYGPADEVINDNPFH